MKIALVGYGKMGRVVEEVATARGIEIAGRFTREHPLTAGKETRRSLDGVTALIDFSTPEAVMGTARAAAELGVPWVIGTTGWNDRLAEVRSVVDAAGTGAVQASNFSLGVNVFYRLAERAAQLLAGVESYDPFIQDWHHRFKQDSPSGTALEIQRRMARHYGDREVPISCVRAGYVPSVHSVSFDSAADTIHIEHRARNRQGFAEGSLLAAQWIEGRAGFYEFRQVLDDLLPAA